MILQLYPSTDLFLHNNGLVASNVQDTNLRDALLGHKTTLDTKEKLFHNTLELHNLIFDFIKLSGKSEFKSVDKRYHNIISYGYCNGIYEQVLSVCNCSTLRTHNSACV